jgi:hypothetical protein
MEFEGRAPDPDPAPGEAAGQGKQLGEQQERFHDSDHRSWRRMIQTI